MWLYSLRLCLSELSFFHLSTQCFLNHFKLSESRISLKSFLKLCQNVFSCSSLPLNPDDFVVAFNGKTTTFKTGTLMISIKLEHKKFWNEKNKTKTRPTRILVREEKPDCPLCYYNLLCWSQRNLSNVMKWWIRPTAFLHCKFNFTENDIKV